MDTEIVDAFLQATTDVFSTMLKEAVVSGPVLQCDQMLASHDVSGIIGLSGGLSGDVIVSFDERVAILATAAMLGSEPAELDNDVVDAVGELTNMIAGAAKGILERHNMSIALPTVILGKGHRVGFKSGVVPLCINFESAWGSFSVKIGLSGVLAPVLV